VKKYGKYFFIFIFCEDSSKIKNIILTKFKITYFSSRGIMKRTKEELNKYYIAMDRLLSGIEGNVCLIINPYFILSWKKRKIKE
jgi:hypothetical protein